MKGHPADKVNTQFSKFWFLVKSNHKNEFKNFSVVNGNVDMLYSGLLEADAQYKEMCDTVKSLFILSHGNGWFSKQLPKWPVEITRK